MTAPLRVLVVDDSETDAKLVVRALLGHGRRVESTRVEDAESLRAALAAAPWDVIICDWSMPRFSAPAALALVKGIGLDVPFLIVSGTIGEEAAVAAMRAGAHDFVLKDQLARLAPAVEREMGACERRAARAREQARFRALIERSEDGVSLTARDGTSLYMSPAAERILGYSASERVGRGQLDAVHPDDRGDVQSALSRLAEAPGASETLEFRVVHPDGSCRRIVCTATNRLDEPAIGAIVGNFRDVTERHEALDSLRISEARFARLSESGIVGIAVADVDGVLQEMNDACLDLLGYTRADFLAGTMNWAALTPPEWWAQDAHTLELLKETGIARPFEKEFFHKDGRRVPALVGAAMLDYPYCIAFVADLTERRRAEVALRQTAEQLRQAHKMEAVGRLAGGVAHDFNNLLCVILSLSHMALADLAPGEPLRDDLEEIRKAGERASELTRQLLLFSRQHVFEPKVLDLSEVLANMDRMLRRLVGEDVELTTLPSHSLGRVRADPSGIEQVVMNLVVNARDAMPTGGKLTLETADFTLDEEYARNHHGVRPGPHVMLAVSDTGSGMDKDTQARIFEPFFTTKEVGKGTGLGLSTVFGIVQQSHGSVWVYSEPGHGTTFKVYLPRVDAALDAPRPTVLPMLRRGTETILLVEDEDQVRAVARSILRRQGYEVLEARNAGEALLLCEQFARTIHLLVTDVVMPQMSGPELARRLAQTRPAMRVLCMSGYTDDSVVRHGVLAAALAYIQKPLTPDLLARKVREVLDAPADGAADG